MKKQASGDEKKVSDFVEVWTAIEVIRTNAMQEIDDALGSIHRAERAVKRLDQQIQKLKEMAKKHQ